jgi:hypothetical protein
MNSLLLERWGEVLDKGEPIKNTDRRRLTAQLLENEEKFLLETTPTSVASNIDTWTPILMGLVRRMGPKLISYDVCGTQPMTGPVSIIFCMKTKYTDKNGAEAFVNEANTAFSGTGSPSGDDPWDVGYATGTGAATATAETAAWATMSFTVDKISVTATSRQLKAEYSHELAKDFRTLHGLDADKEFADLLANELTAEINREIVRTIYIASKVGGQFAQVPGKFDLSVDVNGTWLERIKSLLFAIERDANAIAKESRRGKGNIIITSADVASALVLSGILDYAPALKEMTDLNVDITGITNAGKIGRFNVFVDPYLGSDGYVVGYKGSSIYDNGVFYCPYVPLEMVRATSYDNFTPAIGFKVRYGLVANPFTTLNANDNVYYRKTQVLNLMTIA